MNPLGSSMGSFEPTPQTPQKHGIFGTFPRNRAVLGWLATYSFFLGLLLFYPNYWHITVFMPCRGTWRVPPPSACRWRWDGRCRQQSRWWCHSRQPRQRVQLGEYRYYSKSIGNAAKNRCRIWISGQPGSNFCTDSDSLEAFFLKKPMKYPNICSFVHIFYSFFCGGKVSIDVIFFKWQMSNNQMLRFY